MVAVVNGYVCFTSCDAEKAKQGKDPNAKPGEEFIDPDKKKDGLNGQPATILDGALKELQDAVDPAKQSDPSDPTKSRDLSDPAKFGDPNGLSDPNNSTSVFSPLGEPSSSSSPFSVDLYV